MNPRIPIALALLFLLAAGCTQPPDPSYKLVKIGLGVDNTTVLAQVADTPALRQKGLMGRPSLNDSQGMLFVFNDSQTRTFWMANTTIPLEILFIDNTGTIVDIQEMAPCAAPDASACPVYRSAAPAQYALELPANFSARHSIHDYDELLPPVPQN